jgi:hypothetical protein
MVPLGYFVHSGNSGTHIAMQQAMVCAVIVIVIIIGGLKSMGLAKPIIITMWALKRSVLYISQLSTDYQCSEMPILFQSPNLK